MNFLDERLPGYFWSRVIPEPNSGCWLWIAGGNNLGYGIVYHPGRPRTREYVHRFALRTAIGASIAGLDVDHLCRTPQCCNPRHLEAVTHRENLLRGVGVSAIAARKTQCIHGHPFDKVNTYIRPDTGTRQCRQCGRDRLKEARSHG